MNNRQIFQIVQYYKSILKPSYTKPDRAETEPYHVPYTRENIPEFIHDLTEAGNRAQIIFLENALHPKQFPKYVEDMEVPLLSFAETPEGIVPVCFRLKERWIWEATFFNEDGSSFSREVAPSGTELFINENGHVLCLAAILFDSLVSEPSENGEKGEPISPVNRLFRLLYTERKDIIYIYIFAIFGGIISLALPLGIQAIIGLISGGLVFSSVAILIAGVIIAVLLNGGLHIMQMRLVEVLQRRVFTKAAYEFAFRVPRIKAEEILRQYMPELMNRFFDILTIQKGLPKLLIEISTAAIQIVFGLILIAFYHPFFVFFGIFLLAVLGVIFYVTGPKGLKTSITESKYKYKVVFWLEEMARALNAFKLAGNSNLPVRRSDQNVNNYLHYRDAHFQVLISQYWYIVIFKTLVTGGLLVLGTLLVIDRQITLGQFVASEIVVILILNAVEKIIIYLDSVFDMLTAVDKIGHVTDLPLERSGGIRIPTEYMNGGLKIHIKNLRFRYENEESYALDGIDLDVDAGKKIGITGFNRSGRSTLASILAGIYTDYQGAVTINGFSYRDLDLINMRDYVAKNISAEDVFDGTILDNVGVGKPTIKYAEVVRAIEMVGLSDFVNSLPEGLHTHMPSVGRGFPDSVVQKLILARCIAKNPKLIILNNFFLNFTKEEKRNLIELITSPEMPWTLIVFSNDPMVLEACHRVVVLKTGKVIAEAPFHELQEKDLLRDI